MQGVNSLNMCLHLSTVILNLNRGTLTFALFAKPFWAQTLALSHLTNENKLLICCALLADFVLGVNLWNSEQILNQIASILKRLHNFPKTDRISHGLFSLILQYLIPLSAVTLHLPYHQSICLLDTSENSTNTSTKTQSPQRFYIIQLGAPKST